jgi:Lecithin:cholesterol acyltransferase
VTRAVRPLLVVPGLFQTAIYDDQIGHVWGRLRNLYGGPPIATLDGLRGQPRQIVRVIPIVPGLINYDLMLSLERALCGAGYRVDETLHYFTYDWRLRIVDLGVALAAAVRRLAERSGKPIDMLGLSNGGPMIRAAFAADRTLPVERVVTSGGPLGGSVETLACLDRGFQFAPLGRTVPPAQFMACPGALQAIPSPALTKFVCEDDGAAEGHDLYDVATWRRLRMSVFRRNPDDPIWVDLMTKRITDMRETWQLLDAAAAPKRLVCICGTGIPTQVAIVVRKGRAYLPGEGRLAGIPPAAIFDGDGALTVEQASAWTGADAEIVRIKVGRHRDTVRTPAAFGAILEALG